MDALEYRVCQALREICKETYPDRKIPPFYLEISSHDYRTFHGDWTGPTSEEPISKIRLNNMSRDIRFVILTGIHEIGHHCDYMLRGTTNHRKPFYECHIALLQTACKLSVLTPEMFNSLLVFGSDGRGDEKLFKMIRDRNIDLTPDPDREYGKGQVLLQVFNAYRYKERLKSYGYRYNPRSTGWEKAIPEEELDEEEKKLEIVEIEPEITSLLDVRLYATVTVEGATYPIKEHLKVHGYHYSNKIWYKKVPLCEAESECRSINYLNKMSRIRVKYHY